MTAGAARWACSKACLSGGGPAVSVASLFGDVDQLARSSGLGRRRGRRFCAGGFLGALLNAARTGKSSLNQLAMQMAGEAPASMSRQAMRKRFDGASTRFMELVLNEVIQRKLSGDGSAAFRAAGFRRVILQDGTRFKTHRANQADFPGLGNGGGATAGIKVDFTHDMLSSNPVRFRMAAAREQDRALGPDITGDAGEGDMVLRDMGYFPGADCMAMRRKGAHWISRLPAPVGVIMPDGRKQEDHLTDNGTGRPDLWICLGSGLRARLIACRAPDRDTERRRRMRRAKSAGQGHTARRGSLLRDAWHIALTSLPEDMATAALVTQLYRLRWGVETAFRAWKQALHMERSLGRKSNPHHLRALVPAGMIFHTLALKPKGWIATKGARCETSVEKAAGRLSLWLEAGKDIRRPIRYDERHLAHGGRKRPCLTDTLQTLATTP